MSEQVANLAASTLSAAITSTSATTLTVTSASTFPGTGNFRIKIDTELMLVTAVSGNTFTVTRGIESTTAATHLNLAPVTHILTAGGLAQYVSDHAGSGPSTTLTASSFTWVNQQDATATNGTGSVLFTLPSSTASPNNVFQFLSRPWTTGTVSAVFDILYPLFHLTNGQYWSFGFLESATNKTLWLGPTGGEATAQPLWIGSAQLPEYTYANVSQSFIPITDRMYLQIENDGTNLYFRISKDEGLSYATVYQEAISAGHFTTGPDHWMFGGINYGNSTTWPPLLMRLVDCTEAP